MLTIQQLSDMYVGQRVQIAPNHDAWMMGDRWGVIVRFTGSPRRATASVRMDRSGRTLRFDAGEVLARLT